MRTKESFTRDEWSHLLPLFNFMSFSMFSCSPFSNFLSDPIGKQSVMSKRGSRSDFQWRMAKPKPTVSAKAKPVNLVLRSPRSTRENPPRNVGHPVDPGNVDEGQGSQTSTRKLVRTTQSKEVECSQVMRQENAQNSDSWKQGDREESSNSASTRKPVRAVTPRTEFQNMKYTNHQYMTKVFHFFAKEVGNYSRTLEALKTDVLVWRVFMSSSVGAAIRLGPNCLANLEVHKNTNFKENQSLFNTTQKQIVEHSVHTLESTSPSWTRSTLSHDQVIQWTEAKVRVYSDSVPGQVEEFKMSASHKRIAGYRRRTNWLRVEYSSRIFVIANSSEIHRLEHLHVNVQRHRFDNKKNRWNLYFEFRTVK